MKSWRAIMAVLLIAGCAQPPPAQFPFSPPDEEEYAAEGEPAGAGEYGNEGYPFEAPDAEEYAVAALYEEPKIDQDRRIDRLLRVNLTRNYNEPKGFAYYTYLLFTSNSEQTKPQRLLAARAYLELFDPAPDGIVYQRHALARNSALLVTPTKTWKAPTTPEALIENYDYSRAFDIVRKLRRANHRVPEVALVGTSERLLGETRLTEKPEIISLCYAAQTEQQFLSFRERLVFEAERDTPKEGLVRSLFRAIGAFIYTARGDERSPTTCH